VLKQYVANMGVEIDATASDVNADGEVDSIDAVLLERYIENVGGEGLGIGEAVYPDVESLTLNVSEVELDPGDTFRLTAEILPEESEGTEITWSSSDEDIAKVSSSGLVTASSENYGMAVITARAGSCEAQCSVYVGNMVFFYGDQAEMSVSVDDYENSLAVYSYDGGSSEDYASAYVTCLPAGDFSYTATADGYYASVCGFTVSEDGTVSYTTEWSDAVQAEYGLDEMLDGASSSFYLDLDEFVPSGNQGAWDGVTLDVSWFTPEEDTYYISTPEQLAGLAAIVNGIYNAEITTIIDSDGTYTPEAYASCEGRKIDAGCSGANGSSEDSESSNQVTSENYYYSGLGYDFDGKTVYLTADLDMGGYEDADGNWTGARYMPIGGQYQMHTVKAEIGDGFSHIGASFNGTFDGQGHIVYNIYCDRYSATAYGDSSSVGLIGRLGNHDNDYSSYQSGSGDDGGNYPAVSPTVRNVAVDGWIYARRSVGGIVGKTGKTAYNYTTSISEYADVTQGSVIENCVNFATVTSTDSKGCGGIVGSSWNGGIISNCANFGDITNLVYATCPVGGISGSNENTIVNCYNAGQITSKTDSYAMGIGTNNGGGTSIQNCYWLSGTASGGGYYNGGSGITVYEITDDFNSSGLTAAAYIVSGNLADDLNDGVSRVWVTPSSSEGISAYLKTAGYTGAPVPRIFTTDTSEATSLVATGSPEKLSYVAGETFDTMGLEVRLYWSDGTSEVIEPELSISGALSVGDTQITASVEVEGLKWSKIYSISVVEYTVSSLTVTTQPTTRTYNEGDSFDPTGLRVKITYTNGKTVTAAWQSGTTFVNISDSGDVYDIAIDVEDPLTNAGSNGVGVTLSYTYEGTTVTAVTNVLTVIVADDEPETDADGAYLVSTAAQLDWVANQVNTGLDGALSARLTADITADSDFSPIGSTTYPFTGTLDGGGYTVTLAIDGSSNYQALVGYASDGASVKNLIVDGSVSGYKYVAGLIAYVDGEVSVENCGNLADITSTGTKTGGLIAYIGQYSDITVTSCFNRGNVTESSSSLGCFGGIVGEIYSYGTVVIEDCYNWGAVTGWASTSNSYGIGGIVGQNYGVTTITNSYNAGTITNNSSNTSAAQYAGAIVGRTRSTSSISSLTLTNCWWLEGSSTYKVGNLLTTTESVTLTELIGLADTLGDSYISNGGCMPVLSWQTATGHTAEDGACIYCGTTVSN
ncbi:MAG: Ig-like domain-containing protein, partial [Clostridiales bacterium]|nr:Ig-like domain-containing protein [Clostridiales bacterium]